MSAADDHRRSRRVAIVGGGISGLSAAYRLVRESSAAGKKIEVVVLEAGKRAGGLIRTESHDGALLEGGPDSLVAQKPAGIRLCRELGIGERMVEVVGGDGSVQILHRGRLHPLPPGFLMMAPTRLGPLLRSRLFTPLGKLRMALEPLVPVRRHGDDESLRSFVTRRLGSEAYRRAAEPIIGALFTADGDAMSLAMTMPRFRTLERDKGSVVRGLRSAMLAQRGGGPAFAAPREGMVTLVKALVEQLPEGSLRLQTRVHGIGRGSDGGWRVELDGGGKLRADALVLACPAAPASALLAGLDDSLAHHASALPYASCATINLVYRNETIGRKPRGYGFFVPRTERLPMLACSYVSAKFPGRVADGYSLMRVFLGGARDPEVLDHDDETLIARAHGELARILALDGSPEIARVHRFPAAMPQYLVGHDRRIAALQAALERHPGLKIAGSVVGAFGIPDCIASGETAARSVLDHVAAGRNRLEIAI